MGNSIFPAASASASNPTNDFTINVGTSGYTNVTLSSDFPTGSYICTSSLSDATLDIYLLNSDGTSAGYANATTSSTTVTATKSFNRVVVYGAANNDTLTFAFKYVFAPSNITSNVTAAPRLISLTPASLPNVNNTTVITGQNFATDITITFTGSDSVARSAKTIVRDSSSQLTVTRPDSLPPTFSPYTITATNPGIANPISTNSHILSGSITSGAFLTWQTTSPLNNIYYNTAFSQQLSATDPEGSSVTYAIVSGSLPTGISLSSGGLISGTTTSATTGQYSLVVAATDAGGNVTNQSFTLTYANATGGTITSSGSTVTHTFNSTADFVPKKSFSINYTAVSGGGGGGSSPSGYGGGGGGGSGRAAFGTTTVSSTSTFTIGGAGAAASAGGTTNALGQTLTGGSGGSTTNVDTGAAGGAGGSGGGGGGTGQQPPGAGQGSGGNGGSAGAGGNAGQGYMNQQTQAFAVGASGGSGSGSANAPGGGGGGAGAGGWAGGGAGNGGSSGGGAGGRGNGAWNGPTANSTPAVAGTLGGGGGGAGGSSGTGASGSAGYVIITY